MSYMPLALTLPISACVASTCMEAIARRVAEAKTSARPRCNNRAGAHRGGALPPTTGPRASLTYCSSHSIILLTMTRLIVATLATAAALAPSPVKPAVVARRDVAAIGALRRRRAPPALRTTPRGPRRPRRRGPRRPSSSPTGASLLTTTRTRPRSSRTCASPRPWRRAPNMEMIALNCKKEMIDFVRRAHETCRGFLRHGTA